MHNQCLSNLLAVVAAQVLQRQVSRQSRHVSSPAATARQIAGKHHVMHSQCVSNPVVAASSEASFKTVTPCTKSRCNRQRDCTQASCYAQSLKKQQPCCCSLFRSNFQESHTMYQVPLQVAPVQMSLSGARHNHEQHKGLKCCCSPNSSKASTRTATLSIRSLCKLQQSVRSPDNSTAWQEGRAFLSGLCA